MEWLSFWNGHGQFFLKRKNRGYHIYFRMVAFRNGFGPYLRPRLPNIVSVFNGERDAVMDEGGHLVVNVSMGGWPKIILPTCRAISERAIHSSQGSNSFTECQSLIVLSIFDLRFFACFDWKNLRQKNCRYLMISVSEQAMNFMLVLHPVVTIYSESGTTMAGLEITDNFMEV